MALCLVGFQQVIALPVFHPVRKKKTDGKQPLNQCETSQPRLIHVRGFPKYVCFPLIMQGYTEYESQYVCIHITYPHICIKVGWK